jgi:hypothetical protein
MSRRFGQITQNGYVVPDLDAAMRHWSRVLGIGPWYVMGETAFDDMLYRGRPTAARVNIAMANSGDLQIELIQPLDDEPTPYRDFLQQTGGVGGLQHVSSWPDTGFYERTISEFTATGGEILFQGRAGRTRFTYLDTAQDLGTVFEMSDLSPGSRRLFDAIRRDAGNWDGREPIRHGWPTV